MDAINGVSCIKGEVHNIMTLLRLNTRWADLGFSKELLIQDESMFFRSFRELNDQLEGIFDLNGVKCLTYLMPFFQIITSENASGPLTSAALSSMSKFVLYGFMSSSYPGADEGINLIARCIPRCIFEETDWESDEVILMKLLELSSLCLRSGASGLLTVVAAWEIYETCISIHNQTKASKLLRSEAATALRHLTLTTFTRADAIVGHTASGPPVAQFEPGKHWESTSVSYTIAHEHGITLLLGKISSALSAIMDPIVETTENVQFFLSLLNVALEAGGPSLGSMEVVVDVLRGDICRHLLHFSQSQDLAVFSLTLRVVFNLFMSIKNHMKVQLEVFFTSVYLNILKPSPSSISVAKGLQAAREELALESLLEFCREPSLMHDIYSNYDCDVQCTNLFDSIITVLCRRAIPSGALSMSVSIVGGGARRGHPPIYEHRDGRSSTDSKPFVNILNRLSLEGVLSILHAVAVRCSQLKHSAAKYPSKHSQLAQGGCGPRGCDASLDRPTFSPDLDASDVDAWCLRSEDDDDDDGFSLVSNDPNQPALPISSRQETSTQSLLALSSIHAMRVEAESAATNLRKRKLQKQRILSAVEKFNSKPLKPDWVRYASELGVLPPIPLGAVSSSGGVGEGLCDARSIAMFLKETPGLGKKQVGEYISKGPADKFPFHAAVLSEYCKSFVFPVNATFVEGFRQFLGHFHLPGEAQCIDRIMEAFASRIFEHLGEGNPFVSSDAAFILSFSTIMLNTDLHNTGIPVDKKMTREQFLRNNRGINGGNDLPPAFLEMLYNEIKAKQILVDNSMTDGDSSQVYFADTASWQKLLLHSQSNQAPASFTPTVAARRSVSGDVDLDKMQHRYGYMTTYMPGAPGNGTGTHLNTSDSNGYMTDDSTSKESDEAEYNLYLQMMFPPSAHERDMFQVMAVPVLDVVLEVWETTKDDILLCKTLEGLWNYANICASLNLSSQFDKMIQLMATFALDSMQSSDNIVSIMENLRDRNMSTKDKSLEDDLEALLGMNFNEFFQSGGVRKESSQTQQPSDCSSSDKKDKRKGYAAEPENTCSARAPKSFHVFRGYIMLRLLFHISNAFVSHIHKGGWIAITTLLLWSRTQNALPNNLLQVFNFKNGRGIELNHSPFADGMKKKDAVVMAREKKRLLNLFRDEGGQQGSVWDSVASLGGLFWKEGRGSAVGKGGDAWTNAQVHVAESQGDSSASPPSPDSVIQQLLQISLHHCHIEALLFSAPTGELTDSLLSERIWCMLSCAIADRHYMQKIVYDFPSERISKTSLPLAEGMGRHRLADSQDCDEISGLYVGRHQDRIWQFFRFKVSDTSTLDKACDDVDMSHVISCPAENVVEGDAVLLLEWVCRLVGANLQRCSTLWPSVSKFLRIILGSDGERFSTHCPYLVERAMTLVLAVAVQVNSNEVVSVQRDDYASITHNDSLWESFRLLKDIPHRVINFTADRLGAGLLAFIRGSSEKKEYICTIDEWFLVFSLLSTATVGILGRPYVWESICTLVDNNRINSSNFTPCRNIIFRFLYRVFPSDDEDFGDFVHSRSSQQPESSDHNPWLTGALFYQMRLALMALGGYCLASTRAIAAYDKALLKAEQVYSAKTVGQCRPVSERKEWLYGSAMAGDDEGESQCQYLQFPLPVDDMSLSYNATFNKSGGRRLSTSAGRVDGISVIAPNDNKQSKFSSSPLASPPPSTKTHASSVLGTCAPPAAVNNSVKVKCVEFSKINDVELLWLESVKTFSDYVNIHPVEISKNSAFCLKTIIYGAQVAEIPRKCWLEALTEMLSRLPLHAEQTISSFETQQLKQLQHEQMAMAKRKEVEERQQSMSSSFSLFSLRSSSSTTRAPIPTTSLSSAKLAILTTEGFDICLHCSIIVFDTLVFHFKLLRSYEEFQPFWIKYISILAHNVMFSKRGSLIHNESVDMIGSLFRLLHQTDMRQEKFCRLLHLSWAAVTAICPSMSDLLEVNYPNIVSVLLKTQVNCLEADPKRVAFVESSEVSTSTAATTINSSLQSSVTQREVTKGESVGGTCMSAAGGDFSTAASSPPYSLMAGGSGEQGEPSVVLSIKSQEEVTVASPPLQDSPRDDSCNNIKCIDPTSASDIPALLEHQHPYPFNKLEREGDKSCGTTVSFVNPEHISSSNRLDTGTVADQVSLRHRDHHDVVRNNSIVGTNTNNNCVAAPPSIVDDEISISSLDTTTIKRDGEPPKLDRDITISTLDLNIAMPCSLDHNDSEISISALNITTSEVVASLPELDHDDIERNASTLNPNIAEHVAAPPALDHGDSEISALNKATVVSAPPKLGCKDSERALGTSFAASISAPRTCIDDNTNKPVFEKTREQVVNGFRQGEAVAAIKSFPPLLKKFETRNIIV